MTPQEIHQQQDTFFKSRTTLDVNYRLSALKKLKNSIDSLESEIYLALQKDLGKSNIESFLTEIQVVHKELNQYLKNTARWSRPQKVRASLLNFPSKARRYPEPYGKTLIISPWNYPFQLAITPLIAAVAAGNTVVLKPSEFSTATSEILYRLITTSFDPAHVTVVQGDSKVAQELTAMQWEYIFFTGSPGVGKKIYQAAAKYLTPVTLELGGKNPAVVDPSCNIKVTARRLVWTKFLNAGQTCIAPDYILVHTSIKAQLVTALKNEIEIFFKGNSLESQDYSKIIRMEHLESLRQMIEGQEIIWGGEVHRDQLHLSPTLLDEPNRDSKVMEDEIFGPILPIISYSTRTDIEKWVDSYEQPLGAYVFTSNTAFEQWFIHRFSFGGGAVNDAIVQFINSRLPFGGVGNSGIGHYHGKHSFETFSHYKSVVHRGTWLDPKVKYPPYQFSLAIIKKAFKWL